MQYYEIQEQQLVEYLDQLFKDIQLLLDIAYRQGVYEFPAEEE